MTARRTALVVVYSRIVSDPRVRRQIDWLASEGWVVHTIGLGPDASPLVEQHFGLGDPEPWSTTRWGAIITYAAMPRRTAYRTLLADRIPSTVADAVRRGEYSLIIANDLEFIPWLTDARTLNAGRTPHVHLDLHEVFTEYHKPGKLWRLLTVNYRHWVRRKIAHPVFTTRSTVAGGIAELYREKLGITGMAVIRNSPEYVDQQPQTVDPAHIRLIYHGLADWSRGIGDVLAAVPLLDPRFSVTLMLTGFDKDVEAIRLAAQPLGERARVVPPVVMKDIATAINGFDLAVMIWRPTTANLHYALPNKLFEATQGRLGLVIGRSPMMQEIVERYGNGIVVPEWGPEALAAALNALSADDVTALKAASHVAAAELNADTERSVFLAITGAAAEGIPS